MTPIIDDPKSMTSKKYNPLENYTVSLFEEINKANEIARNKSLWKLTHNTGKPTGCLREELTFF